MNKDNIIADFWYIQVQRKDGEQQITSLFWYHNKDILGNK